MWLCHHVHSLLYRPQQNYTKLKGDLIGVKCINEGFYSWFFYGTFFKKVTWLYIMWKLFKVINRSHKSINKTRIGAVKKKSKVFRLLIQSRL